MRADLHSQTHSEPEREPAVGTSTVPPRGASTSVVLEEIAVLLVLHLGAALVVCVALDAWGAR